MGLRGFLMKPVALEDLAESVRSVLDGEPSTNNVSRLRGYEKAVIS